MNRVSKKIEQGFACSASDRKADAPALGVTLRPKCLRPFRRFEPLMVILALLAFWQFVLTQPALSGILPTRFLGSPLEAWEAFLRLASDGYHGTPLYEEVLASVGRVLTGYAIGASLAVPLGLLLGLRTELGRLVLPIFNFLRPIPALAFIPAAIIWFGIGESGKIFVIASTSFLYTILGASAGVSSVPTAYRKFAANYNLSTRDTLVHVIFPASLPPIIIGLRTALALAWATVVAAELIAAQKGLGYMIMDAATFFQINVVYVGIAFIGLIGTIMDQTFALVHRRVLHWVGK